jgi:hypothetical protein
MQTNCGDGRVGAKPVQHAVIAALRSKNSSRLCTNHASSSAKNIGNTCRGNVSNIETRMNDHSAITRSEPSGRFKVMACLVSAPK